MSHIVEKTVYSFDELSDRAKERARSWWRDGALDYDWWDCIYEDAATIADMLGIDLRQKPVKLMNGTTRHDPAIYFSGFSSQGDGACFEGSYAYKAGCARAVRRYASKDTVLHRIAADLVTLQRRYFYRLEAECRQSGHYSHSGCMSVNVDMAGRYDVPDDAIDGLTEVLRSFADWIYRQLEREYEWLMADEQVDESIRCNEYEFDEGGSIA